MNSKMFSLFLLAVLSMFSVSALIIDSVSSVPGETGPGETSIIEIGIENNREDDVRDVSVSLNLENVPFAPDQSSSEFSFDEIKDGKIRYATFKIKALNNAESGIYKIPIEVTYEEDEEIKQRNSVISLTVNSEPIISASLEEGLLLKGRENEMVVRIVNKGLSDIQFLELEVEKGSYYSLVSPENIYIGGLDSDDFDSAEFRIFFKENSPTNLRIPVTMRYRDALNEEFQERINIDAKVYSTEQAVQLGLIEQNNIITYVVIAAVLIIVYLVYRRIRKSRKRRKEKET
jgi:hypothetical protein